MIGVLKLNDTGTGKLQRSQCCANYLIFSSFSFKIYRSSFRLCLPLESSVMASKISFSLYYIWINITTLCRFLLHSTETGSRTVYKQQRCLDLETAENYWIAIMFLYPCCSRNCQNNYSSKLGN